MPFALDEVGSMKWSWGYRGQQERSPYWCSNRQLVVLGSVQVGGKSPSPASGFRGCDSPLIDGCRESEVSRECLTGDTVCWL